MGDVHATEVQPHFAWDHDQELSMHLRPYVKLLEGLVSMRLCAFPRGQRPNRTPQHNGLY